MGEKIRKRRIELNMTQAQLAERLGISRVQVSYLETGAREVVKIGTLMAIASALDISIDELLSCS
jgi:transcriptional regulator with XRE-family HTH domain